MKRRVDCQQHRSGASSGVMGRSYIVLTIPILLSLLSFDGAQQTLSGNLAPSARANASSMAAGSTQDNLIGGDIAHTRWTAKHGTNPAVTWPNAVRFQEVVIRPDVDPKVTHVDLEVCDAVGQWYLLQSIGDSPHLLPVLIQAPVPCSKDERPSLREFCRHVSMNEIEVYDGNDPPVIELGSDLLTQSTYARRSPRVPVQRREPRSTPTCPEK